MSSIDEEKVRRKRLQLFASIILAISIVLVTLAFSINFYPSGYSVKDVENGIKVEKGIFAKESFTFNITTHNELKISLVTLMIKQLKIDWYTIIIAVAAMLIGFNNLLNYKLRTKVILLLTVTILPSILFYRSFSKNLDFINNIILTLSQ